MERVYLLLRNNQQTGPFTIGELWQQQLESSDMIWIEGKSTAWTYLSELELTPFVKTEVVPESLPVNTKDEIERKAEELRQRILASAPKSHFPQYTTEIETFASPYKLSPEEEIEFIDTRKERRARKNTVLGELVLTCFVIGLFMLGIYKGKSFLGVGEKVQNSVATELNSHDQHTAQKNKPATQPGAATAIGSIDTTKQVDSFSIVARPKQKIAVHKKLSADSTTSHTSLSVENTIKTKTEEKAEIFKEGVPVEESTAVKKDALPKKEIVPVSRETKNTEETLKEEKKGFLKGLFKKKNKGNTEKTENKQD